ncbi:MAG: hypothetical protein AVDCRST_MAG56-7293, partial [uncultured Cytophagales bacterium]
AIFNQNRNSHEDFCLDGRGRDAHQCGLPGKPIHSQAAGQPSGCPARI